MDPLKDTAKEAAFVVERARQDRLPDLKATVTHENLIAALAREAQEVRLHRCFARIAEIEGYHEVSRILLELAESEAFFADGHIDLLRRAGDPLSGRPVGNTVAHLVAVLATVSADASESLPRMARTAYSEGFSDIGSWFASVEKAKKAHRQRAESALEELRRVKTH
jgi:rubrerythrin